MSRSEPSAAVGGAGPATAVSPVLWGVERSLTARRWLVRSHDEVEVGRLAHRHGLPDLVCRVLSGCGIAPHAVEHFLKPTLRHLLPEPYLLREMEVAAERLAGAVRAGEQVVVFADYDVDGATSAALLHRFLTAVGPSPRLYVPDRQREGYGPGSEALLQLAANGASLVITVDCGTNAHAPLAAAAAAGLDVIVIDHHQGPAELPCAVAVINPNRRDETVGLGHLAAVGVAFLFIVAVNRVLRRSGWYQGRPEPDLRRWLDLVALGTVCDMVPLQGVNRAFVIQGLKIAAARGNAGLAAIAAAVGVRSAPTAHDLAFIIGPRINAGGRIGEADLGARLLATDDTRQAAVLAGRLHLLNRERQQVEQGVFERALQKAHAAGAAGDSLVWVVGDDWHPGVLGIVASRLVERLHKPAVVLTVSNGKGVASGRSVAGIDLGRAINAALEEGLLVKGGGHPMAGGFTVETDRIDALGRFIAARIAGERMVGNAAAPGLTIEGSLALGGVSRELAHALNRLAPFGAGNPEPVFALAAARIERAQTVAGQHLHCQLRDADGRHLAAMAFRALGTPLGQALARGDGTALHLAGRIRLRRESGATPLFAIEDAALPV